MTNQTSTSATRLQADTAANKASSPSQTQPAITGANANTISTATGHSNEDVDSQSPPLQSQPNLDNSQGETRGHIGPTLVADAQLVDSTTTTTTTTKSNTAQNQQKTERPTLDGDAKLATEPLHPFVHWSQTATNISLRVDLLQVTDLNVDIDDSNSRLSFSARGKGAHGHRDYGFSLDFYANVDKCFDLLTIERYVLILIKKLPDSSQQTKRSWPRLTGQANKLAWLRVDFDRYEGDSDGPLEDTDDEEVNKQKHSFQLLQEQLRQSKKDKVDTAQPPERQRSSSSLIGSLFNTTRHRIKNVDIFDPFRRRSSQRANQYQANMKYDYRKDHVTVEQGSKNTIRHAHDYKKTYLFLYNLIMFIMFLKVYIVLLVKGVSGTIDDDIVQGAAFIIKILTYTQLLETIHPVLGLVPGGPLMPFTQVVGRLLVNYFLSDPVIRLDSYPFAHCLFIVWTSIEIFRYSFYALRVYKINIYALTWCRYTLFLPLYPMGGFCESMVVSSTIKQYGKTGAYSINLPNAANISFNLPIALKVYTYLVLGPTIYYLMRYMWSQRCKQLKEKSA